MNRDLSIDSLKGFLIILVIFGHLIGSFGFQGGDIWNMIYTFHMPLFVLISGYFSKCDKANISSLLKPLIVFQVLNVFLLIVYGYGFSLSYLLTPYWTLWYLLSLIFWRIILKFLPRRLLNRQYLCLGLAFFFSLIIGIILPNGRILSIQRTISFLPFFLMGYYFKIGLIRQRLWSNNISKFLFIALGVFVSFIWYPSNANILLRGADSYGIYDLPSKCFILCCTLLMVYVLWGLKRNCSFFTEIGKNSLFYYLYHGLIIKFVLEPVVVRLDLPTNMLWCIFYLFFIFVVLYMMSKLKFFRWFIAPTLKLK